MPRASRLLALLAVSALAASGCRPGTALGNRYNNLRAYYNTFYNAERALEEGELGLERSAVRVDRAELVPVFPVAAASGASGPFQEAIDKSAELLRNRPTSKWADDALLVIGKAYFYQRNVVGAEQKFRETIAAAALSDDRRLADEARFWLGRTYALSDRFDDGVAVLEDGLARDDGDRRWTTRMRLALGELYARAGRWDEAAEALRAGAPDERDPDVAARAFVLLGQVEELAGRFGPAAEAYDRALRQRPAYELAFAAEVGRALVLGLDAGDPPGGLAIVRAMRSDDKHYDRRAEVALAEARIRAAAGETAAALGLYRAVLYDEALAGTAVRGHAHYRLGQFYRDELGDYVRASAHFDTAATAVREPAPEVRPARGAIVGLADEARVYGGLASSGRRLAEVDSLLALGALSEDAFRARIDEIEAGRRRAFAEEQRRAEAARQAQAFSGTGAAPVRNQAARTREVQPEAPNGAAGFLSYRDPASLQAGLIAFRQRWGDRPLVPGWRFKASIQAGAISSSRGVVGDGVRGGLTLEAGPPPLDLSAVPRTPAKRAELVTELAGLRYELANAFFLSLGRADTAAALYRSVLADTPDSPTAVRARYALAELERAAGRDEAARPLYEAVAAADTAALGQASRLRLGLEVEARAEPAADSSAAYRAARQRWRDGAPVAAARDLVAFADADPDHPDAPRAYLGAAVALIDDARAEPSALAAPLPDSLVSRVLLAVADSLVEASPPSAGPEPDTRETSSPGAVDEGDPPDPAPEAGPPSPPRAAGERTPPVEGPPLPEPDTVGVAPAAPGPTRLAPVGAASFTLWHHLAALGARYPGTPAAERARALVAGLPAPPRVPVAVPSAGPLPVSQPADSVAADAPVAATEAGTPAPPGGAGAPGGAAAASGLRGAAGLDLAAGGFAWSVRTVTLADEAGPLVDVLKDAGFRVGFLRDAETGQLSVLLGQFESAEAAEAARPDLPAWARIRGTVVALGGYRPVRDTPGVDR